MAHIHIGFDSVVVYLVLIVEGSDGEVKQVVALFKSCTPLCTSVWRHWREANSSRAGAELQESCQELACSLMQLNPYMKKRMVEAAIACWDRQSKGNMSKHASNHGLWIKTEAYAAKDLLISQHFAVF